MTIKRINHTDIGKESISINRFGRHPHTPVRTTDNRQNRNNQHHHFKQSSHFTFSHSFIFHITGFPSLTKIHIFFHICKKRQSELLEILIITLSFPQPQHDKKNGDRNIHHVPHRPAKSYLEDGLEENRQRPKRDRQSVLLFLIIAIRHYGKHNHRNKPNQLVIAIRHRSKTQQHESC